MRFSKKPQVWKKKKKGISFKCQYFEGGGGSHSNCLYKHLQIIYKHVTTFHQHQSYTNDLALYTFDPTTETKDTSEHG